MGRDALQGLLLVGLPPNRLGDGGVGTESPFVAGKVPAIPLVVVGVKSELVPTRTHVQLRRNKISDREAY